jgi:hypothetical protein
VSDSVAGSGSALILVGWIRIGKFSQFLVIGTPDLEDPDPHDKVPVLDILVGELKASHLA